MTTTNETKIAALKDAAQTLCRTQGFLYRREMEVRAEIARLQGDATEAAWYLALAHDAPKEERHRLYIRMQTEAVMRSGNTDGLSDDPFRAEILAEAERIKAHPDSLCPRCQRVPVNDVGELCGECRGGEAEHAAEMAAERHDGCDCDDCIRDRAAEAADFAVHCQREGSV